MACKICVGARRVLYDLRTFGEGWTCPPLCTACVTGACQFMHIILGTYLDSFFLIILMCCCLMALAKSAYYCKHFLIKVPNLNPSRSTCVSVFVANLPQCQKLNVCLTRFFMTSSVPVSLRHKLIFLCETRNRGSYTLHYVVRRDSRRSAIQISLT